MEQKKDVEKTGDRYGTLRKRREHKQIFFFSTCTNSSDLDPDLLVRRTDLDPSIIKQK
jgi:hypothetical protein